MVNEAATVSVIGRVPQLFLRLLCDTGKGAALAKLGEGKRGGHRGAGLLLLRRVVMSAAQAVAKEFPKGGGIDRL